MRIAAVSVHTNDMKKSVEFYEILGLKFDKSTLNEPHVENIHDENGIKLMLDTGKLMKELLGYEPTVPDYSTFAILYDSSAEIDEVSKQLKDGGFRVVKEPWNAFWGQRYCVVKDPNGHLIDLYAYLAYR